MLFSGFWIGIAALTFVAAAIGLNAELNERRWRRERAEDEAAGRAAE